MWNTMPILGVTVRGYAGARRWLRGCLRSAPYASRATDSHDTTRITPPLPLGRFPAPGPLPRETGPREVLAGRRLLVICDVENLSCGARDLAYKMSYARLAELFGQSSGDCDLHAFFSCDPDDYRRARYFHQRGWAAHVNPIEAVHTCRGWERLTNSDNLILLTTAWLVSRTDADLIVVASGDGTLVCDIARFVAAYAPRLPVVTLSLAGSTSTRLDAARNPHIAANLEIGTDVLRRFGLGWRFRRISRVTNAGRQTYSVSDRKTEFIPFKTAGTLIRTNRH